VLYGDPSYVALGTADAKVSQPALPTPADLVARESIRGVVKVRMTKRGDVTGEVLAPTRGGVITQISVDDGTGPAQVVDALAAPPSAIKRTGPTEALPDAPRRARSEPSAPPARSPPAPAPWASGSPSPSSSPPSPPSSSPSALASPGSLSRLEVADL
jgi:hypothetical protein